MSNEEINFNNIDQSPHAIYIVSMNGHKLLYANNAALLANQKNLAQLAGQNVTPLCYLDELEHRMKMLRMDKKLSNYKYKAMNWHQEGTLWLRQEVNLVSDYKIITFGGVECRISMDLMVEETNRFVD